MGDTGKPSLSDDLIIEILSWLPPKTLVRLRSACKSWLFSIGDTKFVAKHRSCAGYSQIKSAAGRIIISRWEPSHYQLLMSPDSNPGTTPDNLESIIRSIEGYGIRGWITGGSCNGLICFASTDPNNYGLIFLCNPSIRKVIPLWGCPLIESVANTDHSFHFGIGFDPNENDYKAVLIKRTTDCKDRKIAVFSMNSGCWRIVNCEVRVQNWLGGEQSVYLNGRIHWFSAPRRYPAEKKCSVMFFDVCNESIGEIQLPEVALRLDGKCPGSNISISAVKGYLRLMVVEWRTRMNMTTCHVWVMKDYGVAESWTKLFQAHLQRHLWKAFHTVTGKILCLLSFRNRTKLVLYDPETQDYSDVCRLETSFNTGVVSVQPTIELIHYVVN